MSMASTSGRRSQSSHRQHTSVSSVASGSGSERRERSSTPAAVESAVTRLLVAIKQLLEALTLWSTGKMSEIEVSNVYVRLGNDFNSAVAAFSAFNIEMHELLSVPDDLRAVLEEALAEDASPDILDTYLPKVRAIITGLLQGLRGKQSIYRKTVAEREEQRAQAEHAASHTPRHERQGSSATSSRVDRNSSRAVQQPQPSQPQPRESQSRPRGDSVAEAQPVHRQSQRISGPRVSQPKASAPVVSDSENMLFRRSRPDSQGLTDLASAASAAEERLRNQQQSRPSSPAFSSRGAATLTSSRSFPPPQSHRHEEEIVRRGQSQQTRPPPRIDDPPITPPPVPQNNPPAPEFSPSPPPLTAPSFVKRYSLSDNPVPANDLPSVTIQEASPRLPDEDGPTYEITPDSKSPPSSPPNEITFPEPMTATPVMESSLAALKRSEALERRASKRFSTYTFSKMTGGGGSMNGSHHNRKSMLAPSSLLTVGDLSAVTEDDETTPVSSPSKSKRQPGEIPRKKSTESINSRRSYRIHEDSGIPPPVPPVPDFSSSDRSGPPSIMVPSPKAPDQALAKDVTIPTIQGPTISEPSAPQTMAVFLQLGRQVKKVSIEPEALSFSSLRVLFVDKFSYNPGASDFPSIYIRDASSGVQYELEDVDEVKDKCLLSLNIEPLDQIKQHIDMQMSSLGQELKDLKAAVVSARRQSVPPPAISSSWPATTPERPSEKQFQSIARRLTRIKAEVSPPAVMVQPLAPQITGSPLAPQMTGNSMITDAGAARIVGDLKTQFDEVQNLRRDLGVMRQIYVDFITSTKESLGALRTQTQNVRALAETKIGGARAYIDSGKIKLDNRSQNILTTVDDLADTVESLRDDVIKRHVSPKPAVMRTLKINIESSAAELESLTEYIATNKPMWKQTWEEELQNIVEEQQFLNHQEEFVKDLLEDHKALTEVYERVEKVISLRGNKSGGRAGLRAFIPSTPEEGHTGLSTVMLEIKGAAVDPTKRMKAIEANQKLRDKELASRSDEFQDELGGFVAGKKLRMTGGAEEAERLRQKRNDLALKAMFNTGSPLPSSSGGASPRQHPSSPAANML